MAESIFSKRLELVPMTPAFLEASLAGNKLNAMKELNHALPEGWPDIPEILYLRWNQLRAQPELQPWLLRAICHRSTSVMVGYIGFHTAPGAEYLNEWLPGAVEFGFSIFPAYRRQGYAAEASRALIEWALTVKGVTKFVLTVAPSNAPSLSLAARLGFSQLGSHTDEIDGIEYVLGLEIASAAAT
jgi:ribosomal-protein-alanine N-acetyltransferase